MSKCGQEGLSATRAAVACVLACASGLLGACQSRAVERLQPASSSANGPPTELELASVELSNPSNSGRTSSPVYFSSYDLGIGEGELPGQRFELRAAGTKIPLQLIDQDGNGAKDGVFGLVDPAPSETKTLRIVALDASRSTALPERARAEPSVKEGGEWRPRQKDPKLEEY